jgi:HlyD family secretion protein
VQVENIENMTMSLSISENDISKVEKGQEVTIEVTAIEDKTYTGTIKSVSDAGTYSSSGTTFDAVVEFENDGNIKPGMSASCEITLEKAEDCVAIPITAVQTKDNQKYVVVVNSNGETENVNIETGISNDSYVQIISGLSGGETIQSVETVTNNSKGNNQGGSFGGGQMGGGDMPSDMGGGQMPSGDMPGGGGGKQDFNK